MSGVEIKRTLQEYAAEARIGSTLIAIAEGESDARFYNRWLQKLGGRVVVVAVDAVAFEFVQATAHDNRGKRAMVCEIAAGLVLDDGVVCIADRDTEGSNISAEALFFSDYPGIESYSITNRILDQLLEDQSRVTFEGVTIDERQHALSEARRELLGVLSSVLGPLFVLRRRHRSQRCEVAFPKDLTKYVKVKSASVELDVGKVAVDCKISGELEAVKASVPTCVAELRSVAYGHDIARCFWAIWRDLRQKHGFTSSDAFEAHLLALVTSEDLTDATMLHELVARSQAR